MFCVGVPCGLARQGADLNLQRADRFSFNHLKISIRWSHGKVWSIPGAAAAGRSVNKLENASCGYDGQDFRYLE